VLDEANELIFGAFDVASQSSSKASSEATS
jgi:hypothetical protein